MSLSLALRPKIVDEAIIYGVTPENNFKDMEFENRLNDRCCTK